MSDTVGKVAVLVLVQSAHDRIGNSSLLREPLSGASLLALAYAVRQKEGEKIKAKI